jgi:magnesium chelatase subunit H
MFTHVASPLKCRHIAPDNLNGRLLVKVVYVVLEPQYQSALSSAIRSINANNSEVAIEVSGYLIEELRRRRKLRGLQAGCGRGQYLRGLPDLYRRPGRQGGGSGAAPVRDNLDAAVVFPSMPQVMRLNKLGSFSMAQLGQSKSVIGEFMKKRRQKQGSGFEDAMLKLLRTLPKVLKYLPVEKAQDARNFMLSFQYWLGGSPENLENFLLMLADRYVITDKEIEGAPQANSLDYARARHLPDVGIWHPMATQMFEDIKEYLNWYESRKDLPKICAIPWPPVSVWCCSAPTW